MEHLNFGPPLDPPKGWDEDPEMQDCDSCDRTGEFPRDELHQDKDGWHLCHWCCECEDCEEFRAAEGPMNDNHLDYDAPSAQETHERMWAEKRGLGG